MPAPRKADWHAVDWTRSNHDIAAAVDASVWSVINWRMRLGKGPGERKPRKDIGARRPGSKPHVRAQQPVATKAAQASPIAGKGLGNIHAKEWTIKSPDGITYKVRNLHHFVRTHPQLFADKDVAWKRTGGKRGTGGEYCNATAGLSNARAGKSTGWKGWTVIND